MGTWNVRILVRHHNTNQQLLFPAEVHYKDDKATEPRGWTPFSAEGDELRDVLFYALELKKAITRPVLDADDLTIQYAVPLKRPTKDED